MSEIFDDVMIGQEKKWSSSASGVHWIVDPTVFPAPVIIPRYFGKKVKSTSIHRPNLEILGLPFVVREEGTRTILESDRWASLRASGETLAEAIEEMRSLMTDVIEEYVLCPEEALSEDAREFRHYLISTLI